jgi:hypothetical protein
MRLIVCVWVGLAGVAACGLQLTGTRDDVSDAGGRRDATELNSDGGVPQADAGFTDASSGFDAGQAIDAGVDPDCPVFLGELGYWGGKVNVHRDAKDGGWANGSGWAVDNDCTSGNLEPVLPYCQKYWDASAMFDPLSAPTPELKPFTSAGSEGGAPACGGIANGPGVEQYRCCKALSP